MNNCIKLFTFFISLLSFKICCSDTAVFLKLLDEKIKLKKELLNLVIERAYKYECQKSVFCSEITQRVLYPQIEKYKYEIEAEERLLRYHQQSIPNKSCTLVMYNNYYRSIKKKIVN